MIHEIVPSKEGIKKILFWLLCLNYFNDILKRMIIQMPLKQKMYFTILIIEFKDTANLSKGA